MSLAQQIMVQAGESAGHASPEALAETLRKGWETVVPLDPQSGSVMIDKFIPQTLIYLVFSEQALKIIQIIQDAPDDADWRENLQRGFETIRNTFFEPFQARDATHPGLAAFWGLPLEAWQRAASSLSFPDHGRQAPAERQEQIEQSRNLWMDYRKAHQEYADLLRQAAMHSLDLLQDKLIEMAEAGQGIETLREFYNLWVDCSEQAYAETVRSETYSRINARMINSLMRFRQHSQRLLDNDPLDPDN